MNKIIFFCIVTFVPLLTFSQTILPNKTYYPPAVDLTDHVLTESELIDLLDTDYSPELQAIQLSYKNGDKELALEKVAAYFKERFSERFFFDWKEFKSRFEEYNRLYPEMRKIHEKNALNDMNRFAIDTKWKRPFTTLLGEDANANVVRRLIGQYVSQDIALMYFYTNDKKYLNRLPDMAKSLNIAYDKGLVESIKDGNGAYEEHRGGTRMLNWLPAHQILLASNDYTWQQQIEMIRTFLHTGSVFYQNNTRYVEGNHQTKGMSALAMISMLFPEIKGTDQWKERAFQRLEEHLNKEVYADGFQFERSTHYHKGDIINYFYPYQLAQINHIELRPVWENKIKGLFDALVKISMPDKNAPALQDGDGGSGFSEINETMAMGQALFGDPEYNYFASPNVSASDYWFFKQDQIDKLKSVNKLAPKIGSIGLPETGYYVMRQGWQPDNLYMIIDAGITPEKPDHLHGDMLGLIGYAYGNMVIPTFNVPYSDKDFPEFKNSWTKNVVQVDSIPHGRGWIPNVGNTGFGSWTKIPVPKVLGWSTNQNFDFFAGSHDGYNDIGVETYRSVYFIKDGFWIVNDQLVSVTGKHTMQQIWQGNYDAEIGNKHIRSTFQNGAGLDIVQLADSADKITKSSTQGKGRSIFEKRFDKQANLVTLLFPFKNNNERVEDDNAKDLIVKGWQFYSNGNYPSEVKSDARVIIKKDNKYLFVGASEVEVNKNKISTGKQKTDLWLVFSEKGFSVMNCGIKIVDIKSESQTLKVKPGESINLKFN